MVRGKRRDQRCVCGKLLYTSQDEAISAALYYASKYRPQRAYPCTVDTRFWHTTTERNKFDELPQHGENPS